MSKKPSRRKDLRAVYISKDTHAKLKAKLKSTGEKIGFKMDSLINAWCEGDI